MSSQIITVSTFIPKAITLVWHRWTQAEHIIHWNFASEDWWCPSATNDVFVDGRFVWRMEAKDGRYGFDFTGRYTHIEEHKRLEYILDDERKVSIQFNELPHGIEVVETFAAETANSLEHQALGWQAILDNFKQYCLTD